MPHALGHCGSRTLPKKWYICDDYGRYYRTEVNPTEFMHRITTYTKPGALLLDSCAGSLPLAQACLRLGRKCICIEMDPDTAFIDKSKKRLEILYRFYKDRGLLCDVGAKPKPPQAWEKVRTWQAELMRSLPEGTKNKIKAQKRYNSCPEPQMYKGLNRKDFDKKPDMQTTTLPEGWPRSNAEMMTHG